MKFFSLSVTPDYIPNNVQIMVYIVSHNFTSSYKDTGLVVWSEICFHVFAALFECFLIGYCFLLIQQLAWERKIAVPSPADDFITGIESTCAKYFHSTSLF